MEARIRGGWSALLVAVAVMAAGVPVHAAPRGAALPDADADGLPDAWEARGVTIDGGAGPRFVDLPAMGADPTRPDVFLQVDAMVGDGHDQRPRPEALAMVVDAFDRAPFVSPTGSLGIALHVDAGPESRLADGRTWGALSRARTLPWRDQLGRYATGTYDWRDYLRIKDASGGFTETGRAPVFHYAIFGHYHDRDDPRGSGASGIARGIRGTDILVTLGNFSDGVGTAREQAGSLMHELGHNLGLRHGGCDDENYKPGYVSVMNYAFQMTGVTRGGVQGVLDFSRGAEPALDEVLAQAATFVADAGVRPRDAEACVAYGETRAGLTVPTVRPVESRPARGGSCEAAFDDWSAITLKVGGIGRDRARRDPAGRR